MTRVTDTLLREADGDHLAYKDALEDLVNRIDVVVTQNARGNCSAADVTAMLFSCDLGNMGTRELRRAGLLDGEF